MFLRSTSLQQRTSVFPPLFSGPSGTNKHAIRCVVSENAIEVVLAKALQMLIENIARGWHLHYPLHFDLAWSFSLRSLQGGLLCATLAVHTCPLVRLSCLRRDCRMMALPRVRKSLPSVPREEVWMCFPKY